MVISHLIKKQTYFDSVTLMLIGSQVKKLPGIDSTVVGMCTDYNIDSLKRLDMYQSVFDGLTPNDLIICIRAADQKTAEAGIAEVEKRLASRKQPSGSAELPPTSQEEAARRLPEANMVLISVPGEYAAREAEQALNNGRHVMLFSDNVSIEEELKLKTLGGSKELLVMGPDCGTAIINGTPLAFANAVRKGDIGVVAASGTGLQEVTSTIHRLGCGITQAIGVGGRDLSEKIGGKMTLLATRALAEDPSTKVIVLLSKPPAESVLKTLYAELKGISKKIVIYFIGADPKAIEAQGFIAAHNLEDAAIKACDLSTGKQHNSEMSEEQIKEAAASCKMAGKHLRGLYSGGTLCDEAQRLLQPVIGEISSNTPVKGCKEMADVYKSTGHCIIDLGDDNFTRGKAHPMIDPTYRSERMIQEIADPEAGLILFDVVLGYGSHLDMAGEMVAAIEAGQKKSGRKLLLAACICGTHQDPQNYAQQQKILEDAGIKVFPTNVAMVKFAQHCLERNK
ncbi:MAG: FdrA family protein [Candidatus Riflebacteria bacterium HGW-Riflebacteria-2]|nr:MAG: FdrA family protein [Candidatus Riflebacteria bacterium HGW-Riflebacteria-2]